MHGQNYIKLLQNSETFDGPTGEKFAKRSVSGDRFRTVTHQEDVLRHREKYVELRRGNNTATGS